MGESDDGAPWRRTAAVKRGGISRTGVLANCAPNIERDPASLHRISGAVIDSALRVHTALGPGLLESAYVTCLAYELRSRHFHVATQVELPVVYAGVRMDIGYRIDLLVEDAVVVEVKAIARLLPIHDAQLLSYLRLSHHKVGLLLNFHVVHLRDGIKRLVNAL